MVASSVWAGLCRTIRPLPLIPHVNVQTIRIAEGPAIGGIAGEVQSYASLLRANAEQTMGADPCPIADLLPGQIDGFGSMDWICWFPGVPNS